MSASESPRVLRGARTLPAAFFTTLDPALPDVSHVSISHTGSVVALGHRGPTRYGVTLFVNNRDLTWRPRTQIVLPLDCPVTQLTLSTWGNKLAFIEDTGYIQMWSTDNGDSLQPWKCQANCAAECSYTQIQFVGSYLLALHSEGLDVLETGSPKLRLVNRLTRPAKLFALAPDHSSMVLLMEDNKVALYGLDNRSSLGMAFSLSKDITPMAPPTASIHGLSLSVGGQKLLLQTSEGIYLQNLQGERPTTYALACTPRLDLCSTCPVGKTAFDGTGEFWVMSDSPGAVYLCTTDDGLCYSIMNRCNDLMPMSPPEDPIKELLFSGDGRFVLGLSARGRVMVWYVDDLLSYDLDRPKSEHDRGYLVSDVEREHIDRERRSQN